MTTLKNIPKAKVAAEVRLAMAAGNKVITLTRDSDDRKTSTWTLTAQ